MGALQAQVQKLQGQNTALQQEKQQLVMMTEELMYLVEKSKAKPAALTD